MGCGASRHLLPCLRPSTAAGDDLAAAGDETLGHSFCYHREHSRSSSISEITTTTTAAGAFKSISGASVSANSTTPVPLFDNAFTSSFSSSASFSALPLQLSSSSTSGPLDRGFFLSGPIERGALSGPLDPLPFSGPLLKKPHPKARPPRQASLIRRSLSERNRPWVVPLCAAPPYPTSLQWAHGKAGEDRVHIVVSEEHHWLFVGIYDGFNGPEAPEFLVANLYHAVFDHLRGLFWEEPKDTRCLWEFLREVEDDAGLKEGSWNWFPRWRYDSDDKVPERGGRRPRKAGPLADHELVLRALARALEVTEVAYLEMTDRAMGCNPELALMGSCLLVALMRDDDVYVMNLGDSRAVVAQYRSREMIDGRREDDEGRVQERAENVEIELPSSREMELGALQLSTDHSTNVEDEVLRIREEHPDDSHCIVNGRVKGRLNVTRAFGAGFLKQPKLNNGLLEMFRNEYVGNAPYLSCSPSLCHHKLGGNDQFLVLSSDGLYQYLSNEEVVLHVENFMERFPDGDPAQSLIEELLSRAAKKAGMDFHELLDIPQGDRRKYHDDITVMVISLEGRIWKSSGKYL